VAPDLVSCLSEWQLAEDSLRAQLSTPEVVEAPVYFVNRKSLEVYARCPLQYRARYILGTDETDSAEDESDSPQDGAATPVRGRMTPADFGSFVHELLRGLMEKKMRGEAVPEGWIESMAAETGIPEKARPDAVRRASVRIGFFLDSDLYRTAGEMPLEQPFQVRLDRAVFTGTFDRVDRVTGGWDIVDYKTGKEKDEDRFQMEYYMWALHKITGAENINGLVCYMDKSGFTVRAVERPSVDIESLARALESSLVSGEYPASPGPACETCPRSDSCMFRQT
jgi:RecB family exonuclease